MSEALKVLVVGGNYPFETFLERLYEGLSKKNIFLTVGTAEKPSEKWLKNPRFSWVYTPPWNCKDPRSFFFLISALIQMLRSRNKMSSSLTESQLSIREFFKQSYLLSPFLREKYDVIYFPWLAGAVTYKGLFALGMPSILSCRGRNVNIDPALSRKKALAKDLEYVFIKADRIHCVSKDILNEAQRYGLAPEKATVIYPAVDPEFFTPCESIRNGQTLKIISVGALIWRKGYEYALQAIQQLIKEGHKVHYQIIGEGPEREHLEFSIHDMKLKGCVQLLGRLSPQEIRSYLQEADIFLHASVSEGIANSVLESMSCGLPAVTVDCGGMREAVTDGVEGFLVPSRDAKSIADSLICLIQDANLRKRMGKAARLRILKEFTLEEQIERFVHLLKNL